MLYDDIVFGDEAGFYTPRPNRPSPVPKDYLPALHRLDFNNAGQVLKSPFRLDVKTVRNNEQRIQSFAYVFDRLAVLTVVHVEGNERIVSFRRAGRDEREVYHEWLENEFE